LKRIILIIWGLMPLAASAQDVNATAFKVEGNINLDTGRLDVEMAENKALYPDGFKNFSVTIKNGKFLITGKTMYPIWVSFKVGDKYSSNSTAIAPGEQLISLNVDSNNSSPKNTNSVMADEGKYSYYLKDAALKTQLYRKHYDSLRVIYPGNFPGEVEYASRKELKDSYAANDIAMLNFIKANPNSYYAMLKLYHIVDFGYNQTLGEAYRSFSTALKKSPYGELLLKKINVAKQIAKGSQLPALNVKDQDGRKIDFQKYSSKKYVLIDLWYSHCAPCIAQFPDLKDIYKEFSGKGFEILSISTDKEKYVNDWKAVILKHKLPWPQYLDLNGVEAHSFNVKIYPSSLLVDQKGKIVATDISPIELKYFLGENLK